MDIEPLTADEETPQPPRKGMSFCKMTLLGVLAMAVVFLVWLFYPVRPGTQVLRAFLPDECVVLGEVHSPAAVNSGLLARKFWTGFRELPVYPLLKRLGKMRDIDLDAAGRDVEEQMRALENAVCGLRNCAAVAFGVTAGTETQVAAVIALDNLGLTLVKAGCMFLPRPDKSCVLVSIPATLTDGEKIPDFYMAGVPGTRYFLLTTQRELLSRYRINSPRAIRSRFAAGRQEMVEFTASLDAEGQTGVAGMVLPGFAGSAEGWWEYADFGMDVRMRLPVPFKLAADAPRRRLMTLPDTEPGLALSVAAGPGNFRMEELSPALSAMGVSAEARKNIAIGLQALFGDATGSYCLCLDMARKQPEMALHWSVDDPVRAQKRTLAGMRKFLEAAFKQNQSGVLGFLPPSALVRTHEVPGRAIFTAPLLPPVEMAFTAGDSSRPAIATLGVGAVSSKKMRMRTCGPQTRDVMRLQWRHAPELIAAWKNGIAGVFGTLKGVQKMFGNQVDTASAERALDDVLAVLASFDRLFFEMRHEIDAVHNRSEVLMEIKGKLRLPRNADGR